MTDDDIARIVGRLDKSDEESQGFTDAIRRARTVHEAYEHGCYDQRPAFNDALITLAAAEMLHEAPEPFRSNIGSEVLDLLDSYGIPTEPAALASALVVASYLAESVSLAATIVTDERDDNEGSSTDTLTAAQNRCRATTEALARAWSLAVALEAGELS